MDSHFSDMLVSLAPSPSWYPYGEVGQGDSQFTKIKMEVYISQDINHAICLWWLARATIREVSAPYSSHQGIQTIGGSIISWLQYLGHTGPLAITAGGKMQDA